MRKERIEEQGQLTERNVLGSVLEEKDEAELLSVLIIVSFSPSYISGTQMVKYFLQVT